MFRVAAGVFRIAVGCFVAAGIDFGIVVLIRRGCHNPLLGGEFGGNARNLFWSKFGVVNCAFVPDKTDQPLSQFTVK